MIEEAAQRLSRVDGEEDTFERVWHMPSITEVALEHAAGLETVIDLTTPHTAPSESDLVIDLRSETAVSQIDVTAIQELPAVPDIDSLVEIQPEIVRGLTETPYPHVVLSPATDDVVIDLTQPRDVETLAPIGGLATAGAMCVARNRS